MSLSVCAQKLTIDTVINKGIYRSYFNYSLREPLYVTYTLYKGGGPASRKGLKFKKCGVHSADGTDYDHSGYDEGHLANAEDFASDPALEEKTFCYFNCVPQTVTLNRGIWKTWEEKTRTLSQTTKLFVVAGSIYGSKTIGPHHVGVPDYCYKIVMAQSTKKILLCKLFPNDTSKTVNNIPLAELKKKLGYELILK